MATSMKMLQRTDVMMTPTIQLHRSHATTVDVAAANIICTYGLDYQLMLINPHRLHLSSHQQGSSQSVVNALNNDSLIVVCGMLGPQPLLIGLIVILLRYLFLRTHEYLIIITYVVVASVFNASNCSGCANPFKIR
jgi:hypothetical protein